ncbi:MAG: VCBS repeat-containing protein [Opitutaceae bacterium]|nr:VCBS repeat-containing protein [Verrucomicrobiales bacterium]
MAAIALVVAPHVAPAADIGLPKFRAVDIDAQIKIGYGLAIADVDGDKRPDILLADKDMIVWYHNPDWAKHVIATNLTKNDNVCIAATDIDGDGKCEIAVGAGWNPGDTVNSGAVFYLIPPADRTKPWQPVALPHEPTVHRMHWVRNATGKVELIVKPLHGRGNKNNEGKGGLILAYSIPSDPKTPWSTSVVGDFLHASHNLQPINWDQDPETEIIVAAKEGLWHFDRQDVAWRPRQLTDVWAGEVRDGHLPNGKRFLATIEPMHGTTVAVYHEPKDAADLWGRTQLDDSLKDGHGLAVGDLLGNKQDQIVVGWRGMTPPGVPGIKVFVPEDAEGKKWKAIQISGPEVAVEDLKLADLNGDGRLDIIAAGRATKNVRIFWNEGF